MLMGHARHGIHSMWRDDSLLYSLQRGRRRPSVVHADRLWRYHGPGRYSWGFGEDSGSDPESGAEEDSGAALETAEGEGEASPLLSPTPLRPVCPRWNRRRPPHYDDFVEVDAV